MDDDAHDILALRERNRLLLWLKSTVEGLLFSQSTNVWNTYGGLARLSKVVHEILGHRLKRQRGIADDYWHFVAGLRVLVPTLTPALERQRLSADGQAHPAGRSFAWVQARLQEHSLAKYLSIVLDDHAHLQHCYQGSAFLRQDDCCRALFVCLEAVDNNELELLARLDPALFVDSDRGETGSKGSLKTAGGKAGHVRSPSLPDNVLTSYSQQSQSTPSTLSSSARVVPELGSIIISKPTAAIRRRSHLDKSKKDFYRLALSRRGDVVGRQFKRSRSSKDLIQMTRCTSAGASTSRSEPSIVHALQSDLVSSRDALLAAFRLSRSLQGDLSRIDVMVDDEWMPLRVVDLPVQSLETTMSSKNNDQSQQEQQQQRSPSHNYHHIRSKSDVSVKSHGNCAAVTARHFDNVPAMGIPMSSSLPSFLRDEELPEYVDVHQELTTPIFRRPMAGQSLTSFLSSQDFRTCAELDKENAHFSISEALIAAIEQIKCNQTLRMADEEDADSDDDEIKSLKQRIRIRRRERIQEKTLFKSPQLLSDGATDTPTTTSQSLSPRSTSSDKSDDNTSDSVDPIDVSDVGETDSTLGALQEQSSLSLSLASLYSTADLGRGTAAAATSAQLTNDSYERSRSTISVSAESVALSLIRKFSEKQLPKASDLEWLVSEQDAPQQLLPLPGSWPISPDDAEDVAHCQQTRLRGNLEWAPPRAQIIFNVHPAPQRKVIMAKQNYRCAGCGTKIDAGFLKRLSYCEYLGKYFCQCCHNGSLACIPARVLRKWDFDRYSVSNFSRDLLDKIVADPLYDMDDLNPTLYRRVKALTQVLQCRLQLYHIKDFVRACRKCDILARELDERVPAHLMQTPHLYSMLDLMQVKSGEMLAALKPLLSRALAHVVQCELCQARGFFCEFCKNSRDVIFPFQLDKVVQCPGCRSCHHVDCYVANKCPKCARIELRRQRRLVCDNEHSEDDAET